MARREWAFVVHDARGREHRGSVLYADTVPPTLRPPKPPDEFRIVVLSTSARITSVPERTAVCVPGTPKLRPVSRILAPQHLPDRIEALAMPPQRMGEYAAGSIVMPPPSVISADDVFPVHSDHPRLDRLALALVDMAAAESIAPYTALIRRELGLSPEADAIAELEARLSPPVRSERPPAKAPGIVRLGRAAWRLRQRLPPEPSLDAFAEDLRLLRAFAADDPWPPEALDRLLSDVTRRPHRKRKSPEAPAPSDDPRIVPLKRPEETE